MPLVVEGSFPLPNNGLRLPVVSRPIARGILNWIVINRTIMDSIY